MEFIFVLCAIRFILFFSKVPFSSFVDSIIIRTNIYFSQFSLSTFADPPEVTLSLGSTLNPDDIKENDDVYFECNVKANPNSVRIAWSHDVSVDLTNYCTIDYYDNIYKFSPHSDK